MNEEQAREVAHRILREFEDLLAENGIWIPSDDRTGNPDEAHLFGREYSRLASGRTPGPPQAQRESSKRWLAQRGGRCRMAKHGSAA